ncbi:hypothetical protein NXH76_11875 [Blautia schinkii]|nr:hypothetical protein [Blautia schinkii]
MARFQEWKTVPGFGGVYQASFFGQVRRVYKNGKVHILTPYEKTGERHGSRKLFVKMKSREVNLAQIIALTFIGKRPPDRVVYHKNGDFRDNMVNNLAYMEKRDVGRITGARSGKRAVVKIDSNGEIIDVYYSAREAGRRNNMSYQTVLDRCNGKVKKSIPAPDGYEYAWEDRPASIRKAIARIMGQQIKPEKRDRK